MSEISGNLLKSHKEVILINLANSLETLSLGLNADKLCHHVIEVNLPYAMFIGCLLVLGRLAIQVLEAKQIRSNSLNLWFYNNDCRFFSGHQLFGGRLETDL
jgi:hypothetical protein